MWWGKIAIKATLVIKQTYQGRNAQKTTANGINNSDMRWHVLYFVRFKQMTCNFVGL